MGPLVALRNAIIPILFSRYALAYPSSSSSHILTEHKLCPHASVLDPNCDKVGAIASENSRCSQIGIDILASGGNAADALVATVFCVGTIGMYHSGIGGGGFMLVRSPAGEYEMIDFRETAPAAAGENMYQGNYNGSIYGGLASGVPGEIRGLQHLHDQYGTLPWKDVVMPAVNVSRYGFEVTEDLVSHIESAIAGEANFLVEDPAWAIDFAPNGTLIKLGDTITRKRYADTLETIAIYGPDAFYSGAIANATITAIRGSNGTMTLDDLKNYTVAVRNPSQINYRNYKLTGGSAPSSGEVALAVMKIVEGYDDFGWPEAINMSTFRLNEAMRFAYGERTQLGDPSFVPSLQSYQQNMVSEALAAEIRGKITNTTHNVSYYDPAHLAQLNTSGTSAIMAADGSGLAISLTTTINLLFGSQLIVPETGVILNNEMNDFSIPGSSNAFGYIPSPSNYIKPGKRPLSSISPVIVEHASNNSLYFVVGAAGGSRIITSTLQSLWHVLDHNMTSFEALSQPRLHDQLQPDTAVLEWAYNNATAEFLRERGVNVTYIAPGQSAAEAVRLLTNGSFEAAGEPRLTDARGLVI